MMHMTLRFFGAAQNVTGSCYCLDIDGTRILIDHGLYQERQHKHRNWQPLPVPLDSIDAVLLTHAHLDHCGRLPKLVRDGYAGPIYCTPATADIARIVIQDSGKIQEEDAAYKRKRHQKEGRSGPYPDVPLYTRDDALACDPLFRPVEYKTDLDLGGGITARFDDAGHILGSSMIRLAFGHDGARRSVLFSGDVGRWDRPILRDPTLFEQADYVVCESTYGNREHTDNGSIPDMLCAIVEQTVKDHGMLVIPSFAVERAQELLYHLHALIVGGRMPSIPIYLDSPMAVKVTEVFERHSELFDHEARVMLERGEHPCDVPGLMKCRSVDESKAVNKAPRPGIVIAGSGMCTGGRIKHHLVNTISRPENTILFIGYQATGTLGRAILEGAEEVRIHGKMHAVRARIARINGFSAHADRSELCRWLSSLGTTPRKLFVTHGEPEPAHAFADFMHAQTGWETCVPEYGDAVTLD
jgi:metallo-beta-lactamase family protein